MTPIIVIPARLAATRLPGKPLAMIEGVPMIVRVLRQAEAANAGPVAVAAGDQRIVDVVEAAGGRAVLTDPNLPSGSDRILAALAALDPQKKHDVVINLQGDIPFMDPSALAACASLLAREPSCDIATLIAPETRPSDRSDVDLPKAVMAMQGPREGRALYFTRSTLYGDAPVWLHIGIYAYRRAALERFNSAAPSPLEQRERLEQLRALEMGLSIWASVMDSFPISVDTPSDLAAACAFAARV